MFAIVEAGGRQEKVTPGALVIVDHMVLPGPGYGRTAYSARVLIHEKTYAGTWSGGDHGGLMNGVITKDKPADPAPK